jgi:hypothetical protein
MSEARLVFSRDVADQRGLVREILVRKLVTARRILHAHGPKGIFILLKLKVSPIFRRLRPRRIRMEAVC